MTAPVDPLFNPMPNGTLRIFQMNPSASRSLVEVEFSGTSDDGEHRYVVHFIQQPSTGRQYGGSSCCWPEKALHYPETPREWLWVMQYTTAKRVHDLAEQVADAEADVEAVARFERMLDASLRRVNGED